MILVFQVIFHGEVRHAFSVTIGGEFLYWTGWKHRQVLRVNRFTGNQFSVVRNSTDAKPMGILAIFNDSCELHIISVFDISFMATSWHR